MLRELDEIDLYVQAQGAGARQTESLAIAFKSFPLDYLFFNKGHEAVALIDEFVYRTPGCSVSTFKMSDTAILNAQPDEHGITYKPWRKKPSTSASCTEPTSAPASGSCRSAPWRRA